MLTEQEIRMYFPNERLHTFSHKGVECLDIPQISKEFLCSVGFPQNSPLDLTFDFVDPPMNLSAFLQNRTVRLLPDQLNMIRIGSDYGTQICIQLQTGHVFSIDIDGNGIPNRFMNSSVQALAECIVVFKKYQGAASGLDEPSQNELKKKQLADFQRADALAMSNENWWALVVEQITDGLI